MVAAAYILFSMLLYPSMGFSRRAKLERQFSWNVLDYAYEDNQTRVRAILSGQFIPSNNLPVGIEIWRDKLFITVPRWRPGIPSTLNYISLTDIKINESPSLIPYPNWESNELGNCQFGLSTVYRIKVDSCDRLWVLDTGTFGIENTTQNVCPYALNIFDLNTNQRIRRYELRREDITPDTFIANIAVDEGDNCDDTYAYMSDELGYGLIVYSWEQNRSWRFSHNYFMPDPLAGDFTIDGINFQWGQEGIFGMSLSPKWYNKNERVLYFSPLASNREFLVLTNILKNESKVDTSYRDFIPLEDRGPNSHTTARVMDSRGIQLFNLIDQNAVGCWNSLLPYRRSNLGIIDKDDVELIFPSDVKIDNNGNVWVISDKMSTFLLSNLDYNNVNFRILAAPLQALIAGTVCDTFKNYNVLG